MGTNYDASFLSAITESFKKFLDCGTSRSTAKLKPLHGQIAKDLQEKLGSEYTILAQGFGNDREGSIRGRYVEKRVDITILKGNMPIAGLGVKFVMQNYSQNSINYFEGMLGETANIRCAACPYFQIFIIFDKLPYYKKNGDFTRWESFTSHNAAKYLALSQDNIETFLHTPNKTLIYVVHAPDLPSICNRDDYLNQYLQMGDFSLKISKQQYPDFGNSVILNDYETFIEKVFHTVKAL